MEIRPADAYKIPVLPAAEHIDKIAQLYAPLRSYVSGVIPLMIGHARQLKSIKQCSAAEALDACGWIGRLITLDARILDKDKQHQIPGWIMLKEQLTACIDYSGHESTFAEVISNLMGLINPVIRNRFVDDYRFPSRTFHCWWATIHEDNTNLAVHLVNAYQPDSPFEHLQHFLTTMLRTIEENRSIYPALEFVSCGSWLNNLPKFQELWPAGFKVNQKILNERGGAGPGAWGQYMTTAGNFNRPRAEELRRTAIHPFALTEARSPVSEVTAHLRNLILKTGN